MRFFSVLGSSLSKLVGVFRFDLGTATGHLEGGVTSPGQGVEQNDEAGIFKVRQLALKAPGRDGRATVSSTPPTRPRAWSNRLASRCIACRCADRSSRHRSCRLETRIPTRRRRSLCQSSELPAVIGAAPWAGSGPCWDRPHSQTAVSWSRGSCRGQADLTVADSGAARSG